MIKIKDKKKFLIFLILLVGLCLSGIYIVKEIVEFKFGKVGDRNLINDPTYQEGVGKLSEGDFEEASKILEESLEKNSNSPQNKKMLAISYYNQEEYDKAEEIFQDLLEEDKKNDYVYYNSLANIYRDKKKFEEAVEYYEKAIEANDKYETAYQNLAILYLYEMESKQVEKAEEVISRGIKNIPDSEILKKMQ